MGRNTSLPYVTIVSKDQHFFMFLQERSLLPKSLQNEAATSTQVRQEVQNISLQSQVSYPVNNQSQTTLVFKFFDVQGFLLVLVVSLRG